MAEQGVMCNVVKTRLVQIGTQWMRIGLAGGGACRELTWEIERLQWSGM